MVLKIWQTLLPGLIKNRTSCELIKLPGGGLFGFDISSMSGVLGTSAYTNYFQVHGSYRQGGITASMPFGSLFGALCSSFIADRYSRKVAIQIASLFWIAGSALQTAANGIALLVLGRFIAGICVGIASSVVPVYQAEIAPKEIRGRVVSLQQWAITWVRFGFFLRFKQR
jgi:MFS family permease